MFRAEAPLTDAQLARNLFEMNAEKLLPKMGLIFQALAATGTEAQCRRCGATERVISLEKGAPLDEMFLGNYLCEACDCLEEEAPEQSL